MSEPEAPREDQRTSMFDRWREDERQGSWDVLETPDAEQDMASVREHWEIFKDMR